MNIELPKIVDPISPMEAELYYKLCEIIKFINSSHVPFKTGGLAMITGTVTSVGNVEIFGETRQGIFVECKQEDLKNMEPLIYREVELHKRSANPGPMQKLAEEIKSYLENRPKRIDEFFPAAVELLKHAAAALKEVGK